MSSLLSPAGIISILIALSVHEWAHAYSAYKLGDPTAKYEGRITLNPIAHLDPLGTLLFILVGFGWGKPVPVNPSYFKNVKRDTAIVAAAGPFSNLVLAIIATILLGIAGGTVGDSVFGLLSNTNGNSAALTLLIQVCKTSLYINLILLAFNLLPIAPLDGSKILAMFIPYQYENQYQEFMVRGPMILLGLLIIDRVLPVSILGNWINLLLQPLLKMMTLLLSLF